MLFELQSNIRKTATISTKFKWPLLADGRYSEVRDIGITMGKRLRQYIGIGGRYGEVAVNRRWPLLEVRYIGNIMGKRLRLVAVIERWPLSGGGRN